ncbi:MAG: adenosylhomocysteinase, partial [Oscillospiraceae bacterium]|nr:adenosylhomocysteinase [Oscillospiraceae bacterium]
MNEAAKHGDIFITVTGCRDVIVEADYNNMKNGAICCNAGHFDIEVDVAGLKAIAAEEKLARNNIMGYKLKNGNWIYIIAEGRLVNLAAGDGHPAEIMDMSFAIQALSALHLVKNKGKIDDCIVHVPREVDLEVARRQLVNWGITIDKLTDVQEKYLNSWEGH